MKILRNTLIISLIMLFFGSCCAQNKKKSFLAKYEFEDFSQFNGINMFFRGCDKEGNYIIFGYAPYLINDTLRTGSYIVILDKKNYKAIDTRLILTGDIDTIKLQKLAQTFIKYEIPRIEVDIVGNVFVYLKDVETLALVRFFNESELQKRSQEMRWIKVKDNWYKPKY